MEFNSIKEYFYKIYNVCYALTLLPLGIFIYLYLELQVGEINSSIQDSNQLLLLQIVFFVFVALILTSVHLVVAKKIKTLSKEFKLSTKMDGYYKLAITRIAIGILVSLLAGAGLYLTGSEVFSVFFVVVMLWMAYHWPSPQKMSKELALKGDEKEMIVYKRESF